MPDCGNLQDRANLFCHDASYDVNFIYRGNVTYTVSVASAGPCTAYKITGIPYKTVDARGRTGNITPSAATSYSLPGVLTPKPTRRRAAA